MKRGGTIGLGSAVCVCVGLIVATSCLLSLGQGFGLAGKGFILPLAIVVVLNSFIAISFAELHRMMPEVNGGVGQYTLAGLGPVASIVSNISAYVITNIFAASVELAMCGMVLHEFLPGIPAVVISLGLLAALFALNLRGIDLFSKIQNIVVFLLIGSMILMGVIAFFRLGTGVSIAAHEQVPPAITGAGNIMGLAAVAFWLFIGVEFIIPVAKDLKNPRRDVLLAMLLGLALLFGVQALLGTGMTHYVTHAALAGSEMPHMLFAENMLGQAGKVWMGLITLLAGISTMNTVLPSVSRILQGMAEEGMAPAVFAKTNRRKVPVMGMGLMLGAVALLLATGYVYANGLTTMILAASCFWLMSYVLTHLNVLILRRKYPDAPRNKKLVLWGLPQVIGIAGNLYMIWNISSDMAERMAIFRIFGVLFVLLGAFAAVWTKLFAKMPLFHPVPMQHINAHAQALELEVQTKAHIQHPAA